MERFIQTILTLDRRWVYLVLATTLVVSLLAKKKENPVVLPAVQNLYNAVEQAPAGPDDGKIILLGMTFSGGTMGESANQARAIIRHLMLRHKRFAIVSLSEPQGAEVSKNMVSDIAKQYGYRYGTDWISFGYQIGVLSFYKEFTTDVQLAVKTDGVERKPIGSFPIMAHVKSVKDVAMLIEITASSSIYMWLQYVQPATSPRLKIGYACTGVMSTEAYTWLDSGQMVGMLPGLKGAADYEKLVDDLQAREIKAGQVNAFNYDAPATQPLPAPARQLMFTQSTAHVVIILFIILGNVALLLSRTIRPRTAPKEDA